MSKAKESNSGDNNQVFMSLAPRSGNGYADSYVEGLDFAFAEQSVCNIGIVGPYASGKTTVLKSYEKTRGQTYVYITLGDYVRSTVQPSQKRGANESGASVHEDDDDATDDEGAITASNSKTPAPKDDVSKAKRETIADLQNRIIEQLLCYESPYGFWRSTIARFWRGANSHLISAAHVITTIVLIASLFVGLDIFGVSTQAKASLGENREAAIVKQAEEQVLNNKQLKKNLKKVAESKARQETYDTAKSQGLSGYERNILLEVNLARADNDAQRELEEMAAAAAKEAARKAEYNDYLPLSFAVFRVVCCVVSLVCVGMLVRRAINSGITIGSFSVGPSSVNVNMLSLPFQSRIDDIIYLFRRTGRTVFVFEDLDRMDQKAEILTSLRELNYKLNTYEKTLHGSRIQRLSTRWRAVPTVYKFVYCIQAGCIPDAEERSKFFDFIVPIVPHGDASSFGYLLNEHLDKKREFKPDSELLEQVGYAIVGMRMYENLVNEYIVHRQVLCGDTGAVTNDLIFAIVAYKNICPVDYARFERHAGFLHEMLSIKAKRDILRKIKQASNSLERDVRLPYVAIYKKYGYLVSWDSALTVAMHAIAKAHGYAADWGDAVYDFVQYALEHGCIREDVRSYATLSHKTVGVAERDFCDSVSAKHWGKNKKDQCGTKHTSGAIDAKVVMQTLPSCAFAANERALNANVLNYLIAETDLEREIRRDEEDPLLELLHTTRSEVGAEFFCRYIGMASTEQVGRFYGTVTSSRYKAYKLLPSFNVIAKSLGDEDGATLRFAAIGFLRLVNYAGDTLDGFDRLKNFLKNDDAFVHYAWYQDWDKYSEDGNDNELSWYTRFNPISDEIANGLQTLGLSLKYLCIPNNEGAPSPHNELLGALVKRNLYVVNAPNISWLLRREKSDARMSRVLTEIRRLSEDHLLRQRLENDWSAFVKMVVEEASRVESRINDSCSTIYEVLKKEGVDRDLRISYLQNCEPTDGSGRLAGLDLRYITDPKLLLPALSMAKYTEENVAHYICFYSASMNLEFYDYLKDYALEFERGSVKQPLNDPSFRDIGHAAVEKSRGLNEPQRVIQAIQALFGLSDYDAKQVLAEIDRLRQDCSATGFYDQLGGYIVKNIDAYSRLLKDPDPSFRNRVSNAEIESAILVSSIDDSVRIASLFSGMLPAYAPKCIVLLRKRLINQPLPVQYSLLYEYCHMLEYDKLAWLFQNGGTQTILRETNEWRVANALVQDGSMILEEDGRFSLLP